MKKYNFVLKFGNVEENESDKIHSYKLEDDVFIRMEEYIIYRFERLNLWGEG